MDRAILLVEDAPNDIELALIALQKCGVKNPVAVTRDGEEAIDYLLYKGKYRDRPVVDPGLILLDLKLTVIDGIEVLRTIRSTPALAGLPVVVLTASAMEADIEKTIALGIEEYVIKPMDLQQFIQTMCRLASRFTKH
jgi:CheY-like chemotaxis protein